jgi:hypothetical protein
MPADTTAIQEFFKRAGIDISSVARVFPLWPLGGRFVGHQRLDDLY